jgi:hypothetical protein
MADVPVPQRAVHRLELKGAGLPVQRVGQPKDAAAVYIFAMENPYVTGQVLFVDGGGPTDLSLCNQYPVGWHTKCCVRREPSRNLNFLECNFKVLSLC